MLIQLITIMARPEHLQKRSSLTVSGTGEQEGAAKQEAAIKRGGMSVHGAVATG
jgi:hypothetical protein